MPGIFGLITKMPREWAEPQLLRMLKVLRHESFYETGTWIDEPSGIYVGWTARENSFSDGMPLQNETGRRDPRLFRRGILRNREPSAASRSKGIEFEADGPSYLVHLYEEDPSFPKGLNGRFQGLLVGPRSRHSDAVQRPLRHAPAVFPRIQRSFLFCGRGQSDSSSSSRTAACRPAGFRGVCCLWMRAGEPHSLRGCQRFASGFSLDFSGRLVESKNTYFEPREWEQQEALDPESYHRNLREAFSRNLPRYLNGKERIGMSLTGGLDTRAVMAWQRFPPGSLPCYTYGEADTGLSRCRRGAEDR